LLAATFYVESTEYNGTLQAMIVRTVVVLVCTTIDKLLMWVITCYEISKGHV